MSEFVLPIRRLLAQPDLDPLIALAAGRMLAVDYFPMGRWLRSLDAAHLQRLRDLRRDAMSNGLRPALRTYATLVRTLAWAEGILVEDEATLHVHAARLGEAVTVATLSQLGYAAVDWPRLSIDAALPLPWSLTDRGKRHLRLQAPPSV